MSPAAHLSLTMATPDDHFQDRSDAQKPDAHVPPGADQGGWQRGFANVWMLVGAAPAGLAIGYFIDRAYGTTPWWMLGLSLLFLAVSLYQLVKDSWK
ncbi:MAG TPA: AtpZ/AtpI family protein [Planctomycetota bacterium]|jgi:ATP synthase protein I|nr:AtpZ/AtpI family protein [Planctomycetota bacterium]